MGYGRKKSASSPEAAPVQVPDFNVTGTLSPDSTCNYFDSGTFNGKPCYSRDDNAWHIWGHPTLAIHYISAALGDLSGPYWAKFGGDVPGNYSPSNGASGTATVSEGGH